MIDDVPFEAIYITDTHFKGKTPSSRTDNYLTTCLEKLEFVLHYANENQVQIIVHGGDFFDANVSYATWYQIAAKIAQYPHIYWYVNVGQHDLAAHSHASLQSMPLGCMEMIENFIITRHGEKTRIGTACGKPVYLLARWFEHGPSTTPEFYTVNQEKKEDEWLICTSHGLLTDEPFFGGYVLVDELPTSDANLFLASDYHPGWRPRVIGKTHYYAPGSLLRPAKPGNQRMPKLLHITMELETFMITQKPITDKFPFREDAKALAKEHLIEDELYVGLIDKIEEERESLRFVNPVELINQLAQDLKIAPEVHQRTLQLMNEAEEKL